MKKEIHERKCMAFSVKMFRVVGCWPNWKQKHKRSEQLYFCYTAATCLVLFVYTVILSYGLAVNYTTWSSLEEALEELIVFATGFIVFLKLILYLWKQNELQKMIDYINNNLNARQLRDEEDISVIKACVKHERSLTKTYVSWGYNITILYTVSSIIKIIKERVSSTHHQTLPLKYPFYPKDFPMYHLLYFHQMVVMILNGHIGTLADTFFSCLAHYISGHFDIIKNRIAKEGGVISRDFVRYHNEIIRLVENLQSIFSAFLMFQLSSNALLICLGVLQITQNISLARSLKSNVNREFAAAKKSREMYLLNLAILLNLSGHNFMLCVVKVFIQSYSFQTKNINLLHYIKCLIYVSIKLIQMFLYCWYGEQVMQKSVSISLGSYSGMWHLTKDKLTINNLRMVLTRSQIPVKITAGNFFIVSLPTLAKVMNAAYSLFTMIKSTEKK